MPPFLRPSLIFFSLAVAFSLRAISLRYREEVAEGFAEDLDNCTEPPRLPPEERRRFLRHERIEAERRLEQAEAAAELERRELAVLDAELRSLAPAPTTAPTPKAKK